MRIFQEISLKEDDSSGKWVLLHSLFFLLPAKNMEIMVGLLPISLDNKSTLNMKSCSKMVEQKGKTGLAPFSPYLCISLSYLVSVFCLFVLFKREINKCIY